MLSSRDRLLQQCTVKLVPANSRDWGTGFLVTPNRILTCAHVVEGHEALAVWWRGQAWATAKVEQILPLPVDLALLQLELPEGEQPPWVLLSETFNPFDRLYVYGYPDDFPDGGSVTVQCEGEAQEQGVTLIKAQAGQVRPGHSGSPALNWETGQVCGVVSDTRSRSTDLGGLLIPISTVFSHFPDIQAQNQAAHARDSLWFTLPLQTLAISQPRSPVPPPQFSTYHPDTFAGRTAETATLTAYLCGSCRILAITGMTGIGKTALAERIVANVRHGSPVPLLPREKGLGDEGNSLPYYRFSLDDLSLTPDFASSGAALLRALGEEPTLADQQDSANLVEHILQRLNRQPCRLQIDSLERLLRGNEQEGWSEFCDSLWLDWLQKILAGTDCPSQLILTSQDIPGDLDAVASRYPQFWHCEPLQGLNSDEQRTLFQNLGFPPSESDWEMLQRIGAFYDGHPLVLQVIAEEIRQRPFQGNIRQYWHHYEAEFTTTTAPATATKLDRSRLFRRRVRQRVEQTIERLPEAARQMLCASAVFRRPVPIEFWQAMLTNGDPQFAFDILQDRHLVEYAPMSSGDQQSQATSLLIRQHNLIRSVAYALLKADQSTWEAAERQAAHLWLHEYQPTPDAPNLETVRGYLEAFDHCYKVQDWESAHKIAWTQLNTLTQENLCLQLGVWGCFQEQLSLCLSLLNIAQNISSLEEIGCIFGCMGLAYESLGQYKKAIFCHHQHLEIATKLDTLAAKGAALGNLGNVLFSLGRFHEARNLYMKHIAIAHKTDDSYAAGNGLNNLGNTFLSLGQHQEAIECYKESLQLKRGICDLRGEANTLNNLGNVYACLKNYSNAIHYYQQSLDIKVEIGDSLGEGNTLGNLASIYDELENHEQAICFYKKALIISRKIGDRAGEGGHLCNMGATQIKLAQYSQALASLSAALEIFQDLDAQNGKAHVLISLAELHQATGDIKIAQQYAQQALTLATTLDIPLKAECEALLQQIETSGGSK